MDTVEKIARDFAYELGFTDRVFLRGAYEAEKTGKDVGDRLLTRWIQNSMMRHIRNEYGLWYNNPLTEKWRTDERSRKIIDGTDYSEDHPDNISAAILQRTMEIIYEEDVKGYAR